MEIYTKTKESNEIDDDFREVCPCSENLGFRKRETRGNISLEQAQELSESTHIKSKNQILEINGNYLSPEGKERLEKGADTIRVVPYRDGIDNIGSFFYHDGKTEINICAIDVEQIERTMQHETNHLASFNSEVLEKDTVDHSKVHVNKISGIHSLEYTEDSKNNILEFIDRNRGFNEGITQMYTNRQLELIEPGKGVEAARRNGYMFATELSEQVEQILGPEIVAEAYYGGKMEGLKARIDDLGGCGAFERLSKDMDKVTYSRDYVDRIFAMRDAQELLANMSEGEAA